MKLRSCLFVLSLAVASLLPACSSLAPAVADLTSPQGKRFEAALFSDAVSITAAALAKGTNPQADIAAANAIGSTLEAYSTLPTSGDTIQRVAAAETGAASTVTAAVPDILALVDRAKAQGASAAAAKQIVASGVYAATAKK